MRINTNRKLALRVLSTAALMAMVSSIGTAAFADTYDLTKGSVTVNAKSNGTYVTQKDADGNFVKNGEVELKNYKDETPVTLTTKGEETDNTASIYTDRGVSTTVTLDNVNINASETGKAAIYTQGKVTLELDGDNTLTGGEGHAALEKFSNASRNNVPDGNYTLTLQDETTGDGKTGSLTATGGAGGAGIGGTITGGGYANNITITGGTITATGGKDAAGIGGGRADSNRFWNKDCGGNGNYITISGANTTVKATGGEGGAGIGGGKGDDGPRSGQGLGITIQDGAHVEATGGEGGAGIGGGSSDDSTDSNGMGSRITITGDGTYVKATGGADGAGIGGGKNGQGQSVTIDGAVTVIASGTGGGAGIGGGSDHRGCTLSIQDGKVTATGGAEGGSGIGGGSGSVASIKAGGSGVTISGGTVNATGGAGAAGIGSGANGDYVKGSYVTITDGTVNANGGKGAAGIGDGANNVAAADSVISITGGTVKANGGAGEAAGIGNGENDARDAAVSISATNAALDVTAVTQGSGEAITGGDDLTMAKLDNLFSGVVRFFRGTDHYNTVHNGKYVGMDDNNADEHKETDAHIWGSTEIIRQATPTEQGILRHHCAVDGCKGYYDEFFDYVAPAEPVTPAPTDPDTPDVPGTSDSTPGTAGTTPADGTVLPGNVQNPDALDAKPEDAPVTPANAVNPAVQNAKALPQTGANWLAVLGTALSGAFLMAAGFFLDRKRGENR